MLQGRRQRLRVLIVQTTAAPTAETSVLQTLLASLGHMEHCPDTLVVQGVSRRSRQSTVAGPLKAIPGVSVLELDMGLLAAIGGGLQHKGLKAADLLRLGLFLPSLLNAARQFQPDVVLSAQQKWDLRVATCIARLLRRPQVVHLHYRLGPWLGYGSLRALRQARLVICVSDFIREQAASTIPGPELRTLHNSVFLPDVAEDLRAETRHEVRRELGIPGSSILVGMIARLSSDKGQVSLLQAMVPILRRRRDVHLLLAGGEYPPGNGLSALIEEIATREGVVSQIHLLGHRRDVARLLLSLDLFAHPSRADPLPLAVLESMAYRLPVVAVREGGLSEMIVSGETGLLADPGDQDELTWAIECLVSDAALRAAMGEAGRARAARAFNPDAAGKRFVDLLRDAAPRPGLGDVIRH